MTEGATTSPTQEIVVDEVFPHPLETLWTALTDAALIGRWLMPPNGFEPVVGKRFTFQTTPAGAWDGTIRCQVLDVVQHERFAFTWESGDDGNAGYGSRIDTVVTFTITRVPDGTRLRLVHAGFVPAKNETAVTNLGEGWRACMRRLETVVTAPS